MASPDPRRDHTRDDYALVEPVTTRWHDNDVYGHVNNAVYYSWFDTAVNRQLLHHGLDPVSDDQVGLVVSSACEYFAPVSFPAPVEVGLQIGRLGRSSVHWELAVFATGATHPCAAGRFVHVFVDRWTNEPVSIPAQLRAALEGWSS